MTSVRSPRASRRDRATSFLAAPAFLSSLFVTVVILAANAVYLLRIRTNNPLQYFSGVAFHTPGVLSGGHTIDGNEGWTAQALGRLAAQMWQHGQLPLWNYYEGLGQPLAGEMQSAALFLPFILLQLLPNGIFVMHLALEFVAAFSTLMFVRSLRLSWVAAACAACLFGLNGAFSVMTNAPFNPIAFLPMALWGVELIGHAVRYSRRPRAGLWVTALAVAFMLFAGFPETALLEGLFVAGWAVVRLVALPGHRRSFTGWTIVGAVLGVVIAAPVLVAFKDFLDFGYTAYHLGAANVYSYKARMVAALGFPYASGPMTNKPFNGLAGYVTLPTVFVAILGFLGGHRRALRIFIGLTLFVLVINAFGGLTFIPVKAFLNVIPGVRNILVAKYGVSLIEFAVIVCAAYGIDDLRRARVRRPAVLIAAASVALYLVGVVTFDEHRNYLSHPRWTIAMVTWTVLACVVLAVIAFAARSGSRRVGLLALVAALIVIADGAGTYAVPQLSASTRNPVDLAPVRYLQTHLGTSRFYTLGPIAPNYGSYWGIASVNVNDLPVPKKMSTFVFDELRPRPGTPGAKGTGRAFIPFWLGGQLPSARIQRVVLKAYGQQQSAFRKAGAEYIVMTHGVATEATGAKYGLTRVFRDAKIEIWRDPKAAPYYSTSKNECSIRTQSLSGVTLDCALPTTLLRRQLSSPGWTATVNGTTSTVVDTPDRLFQSIPVPAGVSTISYSYMPKYFVAASALSLAAVALMLLDGGVFLVLRRRSARPAARQPDQARVGSELPNA